MISVNKGKCLRCKVCISDCPVEILSAATDGVPAMPPELEKFCIKCQHCLAVCPAGALSFNDITPEQCDLPQTPPTPEAMLKPTPPEKRGLTSRK